MGAKRLMLLKRAETSPDLCVYRCLTLLAVKILPGCQSACDIFSVSSAADRGARLTCLIEGRSRRAGRARARSDISDAGPELIGEGGHPPASAEAAGGLNITKISGSGPYEVVSKCSDFLPSVISIICKWWSHSKKDSSS